LIDSDNSQFGCFLRKTRIDVTKKQQKTPASYEAKRTIHQIIAMFQGFQDANVYNILC